MVAWHRLYFVVITVVGYCLLRYRERYDNCIGTLNLNYVGNGSNNTCGNVPPI